MCPFYLSNATDSHCSVVLPNRATIIAGMPLGEWAAVARVQQAMLREHYPQRVDMLNAMEFLWWVPPAATLPGKYYQPVV